MSQDFNQYFRNLNTVGWVKWTIIIGGSIVTFIGASTESDSPGDKLSLKWGILGAFVAPCLIIPIGSKLKTIFSDFQVQKPRWNDNPYTTKKPLVFFDFFSVFFLFAGLSRLASVWIYRHSFDLGGALLIAAGIGVGVGIKIALRWSSETNKT